MTYASLSSTLVTRSKESSKGRRALVLTDDGARHPYRATLPPHVGNDIYDVPAESLWRLTADDVRGVVNTYVATTAAVLVFIM